MTMNEVALAFVCLLCIANLWQLWWAESKLSILIKEQARDQARALADTRLVFDRLSKHLQAKNELIQVADESLRLLRDDLQHEKDLRQNVELQLIKQEAKRKEPLPLEEIEKQLQGMY